MQIDAHQHFWRVDRGDYGWLTPAVGPIYRDFGPADLRPLLARHGIAKTILVQAAQTVAETEFLLSIANDAPFVAGVVGWVDFPARSTVAAIARLAENPLLVGLRPMVQDIADDDWLLRADLAPAIDAMVQLGLVFDALVLPRHLPRLLVLLDRHPGLRVVLDHGAKPFIRDRRLDPWRADVAAVAARANTTCKISGLVTEARTGWTVADLRPYVDHLLQVFGPERLLWGSDWPVVERARGYDDWRAAAKELLSPLTEAERLAIFGGNAERIYLALRGRKS
ncbi:MAG: amidohydrolase family protein [Proteobacteria bacterium]|nr:amidohydrolase family protein [Pseudomonadota bacterium]